MMGFGIVGNNVKFHPSYKNLYDYCFSFFCQEIEKEKAARSDLERTVRVNSVPSSDQTPKTKHNSAFENGVILRLYITLAQLSSLSYFL